MKEKEKMAKGLLYNANYDETLIQERAQAKELIHVYNSLPPTNLATRKDIVRKLLRRTKGEFLIEQPFYCDYGYNISIGENFYANVGLVILDGARVSIGDNVFIAPYVGIYTAGHPLDVQTRNRGLEYAYPITIESNVWIGGHTAILPGVTIGEGAVIGAGSIVTKDIPPGMVAVGNPCRVMKKIQQESE